MFRILILYFLSNHPWKNFGMVAYFLVSFASRNLIIVWKELSTSLVPHPLYCFDAANARPHLTESKEHVGEYDSSKCIPCCMGLPFNVCLILKIHKFAISWLFLMDGAITDLRRTASLGKFLINTTLHSFRIVILLRPGIVFYTFPRMPDIQILLFLGVLVTLPGENIK